MKLNTNPIGDYLKNYFSNNETMLILPEPEFNLNEEIDAYLTELKQISNK